MYMYTSTTTTIAHFERTKRTTLIKSKNLKRCKKSKIVVDKYGIAWYN